jgi:hypothetical protein
MSTIVDEKSHFVFVTSYIQKSKCKCHCHDSTVSLENVKRSLENVKRSLENVKRSLENVKRSLENVKRSGHGVKRSGRGVKRSGRGVKRSGRGVKRSGRRVKRSGRGVTTATTTTTTTATTTTTTTTATTATAAAAAANDDFGQANEQVKSSFDFTVHMWNFLLFFLSQSPELALRMVVKRRGGLSSALLPICCPSYLCAGKWAVVMSCPDRVFPFFPWMHVL